MIKRLINLILGRDDALVEKCLKDIGELSKKIEYLNKQLELAKQAINLLEETNVSLKEKLLETLKFMDAIVECGNEDNYVETIKKVANKIERFRIAS